MDVDNPATGERIASYERDSDGEVDASLDLAVGAFDDWRDRSVREREKLPAAVGDVLRENKREYAELMIEEVGKPISQAVEWLGIGPAARRVQLLSRTDGDDPIESTAVFWANTQ